MKNWKTCQHKWESVSHFSFFGVVHQDECTECGCIGVLADEPDEDGFFQIVAQPMADVIDLNEFRKRKELQNAQTEETKASDGTGSN